MYDDTIAAISTPIGEGAIGVVRVSGPDALAIAANVFTGKLAHRHLSRGQVVEPNGGAVLDEVMATCMLAPNSYTCEDTVEIYGHRGRTIVEGSFGRAAAERARAAEPGEFTLRAFLNGRIDLSQAEAVRDVIEAKTDAGLRVRNARAPRWALAASQRDTHEHPRSTGLSDSPHRFPRGRRARRRPAYGNS